MDIETLYEDKSIIVCVKPAGVVSEDGGMPDLLSGRPGAGRVYCVHRLDRDVSGIMLYAKTPAAAATCSAAFSEGNAVKEYYAAVAGRPCPSDGTMTDYLFHDRNRNKSYVVSRPRNGVREAVLSYSVRGSGEYGGRGVSLVAIRLQTGRTHQIRVQFASRGMPLIGDRKYGGPQCPSGIALISRMLEIRHPGTGKAMRFEIPLPVREPWTAISYFSEAKK